MTVAQLLRTVYNIAVQFNGREWTIYIVDFGHQSVVWLGTLIVADDDTIVQFKPSDAAPFGAVSVINKALEGAK